MRICLFIIACLFTLNVFSQERPFYGRVIDKDTRMGIPFCIVKVKDRNEGVYTDENGRFSFSANADSARTFIFYCLGYTKLELKATDFTNDTLLVSLHKEFSSLKEVVISDKEGKSKSAWIGKRKSKHVGDCYQKYGEEDAAFLKADKAKKGFLKEVYIYITDEGIPDSKFRVHIYTKDSATNLPAEELTDSNLIVHATTGNEWVKADLSDKRIAVNDGVFVSVEWIGGHGNNDKGMQSVKHTEVDGHNGQVMGLTRNTWKKNGIKYMYHRDAFDTQWRFNYSPLLCPMIYAKYAWYRN